LPILYEANEHTWGKIGDILNDHGDTRSNSFIFFSLKLKKIYENYYIRRKQTSLSIEDHDGEMEKVLISNGFIPLFCKFMKLWRMKREEENHHTCMHVCYFHQMRGLC
jgi:hypothetical protein